MKKKLYIKNAKGEYEEYIQEKPKDDPNLLYKKINGKYIPCSRVIGTMLQEGVWAVISNRFYHSTISGSHLKDLFQIHKVSGIEEVTIAQLAGLEHYANYVLNELDEYDKQFLRNKGYYMSTYERIHFIIGKVFEYSKLQEIRGKKEEEA